MLKGKIVTIILLAILTVNTQDAQHTPNPTPAA
jgi:hypothetical protein